MLVTLEGIDGSGKSTVAGRVAKGLREAGVRAKQTEEPTATWIGQGVRRGIRDGMDPLGLAFLFMADRAEHVRRIQDWEQQGYLVLSDRYADSTIAYQAVALADRLPEARAYLERVQWEFFPRPALTVWLDVDPAAGLDRIKDRDRHERFEKLEFLEQVRANYAALAEADPARWRRVDAGAKPAAVAAEVLRAVLDRLASTRA
jgi:dTMP kinase